MFQYNEIFLKGGRGSILKPNFLKAEPPKNMLRFPYFREEGGGQE